MARFDLHRDSQGWLLDVQSELTEALTTRVVVPLLPPAIAPPRLGELNPVFVIEGEPYVFVVQLLAAIPRRELARSVASLSDERDAITRALDLVFTGF